MKILHSVLIVGTITSFALANNVSQANNGSGVFVGIEGGAMGNVTQFKSVTTSGAGEQKGTFRDKDDWTGNVGLKLGYYINNSNRIYLGYTYDSMLQVNGTFVQNTLGNTFTNSVDAKFQAHKIVIGYDYIYNIIDNHNFTIGAYLGYGASVGKFNVSSVAKAGKNMLDPNHFTALYNSILGGINIGYIYNLNFNNSYFGDIEAGVRLEYLSSFPTSKTISVKTGGNKTFPSNQKGSMGVFSGGFYLGYSYKF